MINIIGNMKYLLIDYIKFKSLKNSFSLHS